MTDCDVSLLNCATCTNTSICDTCNAGHFKVDDTTCTKCGDNCNVCTDATTCGTCADKFHIDTKAPGTCKADCEAASCAATEFCDTTSKECTACDPKCSACTAAGAENCSACTNGNFLSGTTCDVCAADQAIACTCGGVTTGNCATCGTDPKKCASCIGELVLDDANGTCGPAAPGTGIENCATVNGGDDTKCDLCKNNYYLADDQTSCTACAADIAIACTCGGVDTENCGTCKDSKVDNTCATCMKGYEIVSPATVCTPKQTDPVEDCTTKGCLAAEFCNTTSKKCEACNATLCATCETSANNCLTCKAEGYAPAACTDCADNYVKKAEVCAKCDATTTDCTCNGIKNCAICIQDSPISSEAPIKCEKCTTGYTGDKCDSCFDGFFMKEEVCTKCTEGLNCGTCENAEKCNTCAAGFEMTTAQTCQKECESLAEGKVCVDGKEVKCGVENQSTACKCGGAVNCLACDPSASTKVEEPVVVCPDNCTCDAGSDVCTSCKNGTDVAEGKCPTKCGNILCKCATAAQDTCTGCISENQELDAVNNTCKDKVTKCTNELCTCDSATPGVCTGCADANNLFVNAIAKASEATCQLKCNDTVCSACSGTDLKTCDACKNGTDVVANACPTVCDNVLCTCTTADKITCAGCLDGVSSAANGCAGTARKCLNCLPGYKFVNNKCTDCMDGYQIVGDFCFPMNTEEDKEEKKGLSGGAIAGIVIGVLVVVGGVAGGVFYYMKKVKGAKTVSSSSAAMQ